MASDRPNQTLADYVAIAISPALIMALVGSLVFFLLEVLYPEQGEYKDRLRWTLFFFVLGAVLVGRVSMTQGIAGRAGLYGLLLAGLTWVGMQAFVDYPKGAAAALAPVINLLLVGVVWWCAHRLTWDCTQIDEDTEVNGEGLLQATGLEKPAGGAQAKPEETDEKKDERPPDRLIGWWERYQRFREGRNKRRVLGGWVVYFSLAALPLFGLGEALIPADEMDRRQYAFWLMCLYVGSGLGLLLTTCFLGLRRYLRQRRLQMPAAMTGVWLTAGGGLIVVLLVIGALLPRPRPEYSLISFPSADSQKRSASNYAGQGGSSGQGEGRRTGDQPKNKGEPSADKNSQASGRDKGQPAQDKDKGGAGEKDKEGSGKGQDKDSSQKGKGADDHSQGNQAPDQRRDPSSGQQQPPPPGKTAPQQNPPDAGQSSSAPQPSSHPGSSFDWTSALAGIALILKWVVFALLILAVAYFLMREGLKFLANFTDWAKNLLTALQNLWANLFRGAEKGADEASGEGGAAERRAPPRPFSSFVNPFLDGGGEARPIKEVVRYTFDALQAWARERNVERRPEETPLEFAARLGEEFPAMAADVRRFAGLYARAAYDYGPLPGAATEAVRRFWERLETAAEQPMSA